MLVVHGIWAYGALQLWAEDPSLPAAAPARGGRPSRAPRPHPFAAPAAELADALACLPEPLPDLAVKAVDDELTLRLPAVGDVLSRARCRAVRAAGHRRRCADLQGAFAGRRVPAR